MKTNVFAITAFFMAKNLVAQAKNLRGDDAAIKIPSGHRRNLQGDLCANIPDDLFNVPVFITNVATQRYLFSDGKPIEGPRGKEGGWLESPKMQGADANYYNRALFTITKTGGGCFLENMETGRYVFSAGDPIKGQRGSEGGWKASSGFEAPQCIGVDANYYNGAVWRTEKRGDNFIFVNMRTERYLFADGEPIKGPRGAEGGWKDSSGFEAPDIKGTDANYYNHALWSITKASEPQTEIEFGSEDEPKREPELEPEPKSEPKPEPKTQIRCPDLSNEQTGNASLDPSCVCNSAKSNKITLQGLASNGQDAYSCVLPDYSDTKCTSTLDCNYVDSHCACVKADYNGPDAPLTCNQYQCIPKEGAASGESCYANEYCAPGLGCSYINGDSNNGICQYM